MTTAQQFTDEELTAFLDGEAPAELIAAVVVASAADFGVRERLDRLRVLGDQAARAAAPLLASAPPIPEEFLRETPSSPWLLRAGFAASLVLGVLIGTFGGPRSEAPGWMEYVAAYQALYVPETLTALPAAERSDPRLDAALGRALPDVEIDGLSFRRAQLLGFEGRPLVQMAFLGAGDVPIALCITPLDGAEDRGLVVTELEGLQAAHWQADGYGYLLIGGQDAEVIRRAASDVVAKL